MISNERPSPYGQNRHFSAPKPPVNEDTLKIIDQLLAIAKEIGSNPARVALAWALAQQLSVAIQISQSKKLLSKISEKQWSGCWLRLREALAVNDTKVLVK